MGRWEEGRWLEKEPEGAAWSERWAMTKGQFEILLSRLDAIDERLREVEIFQAGSKAVRNARQSSDIDVRWRLGIIASLIGALVTLATKAGELLSNGGK